MTKTLSVRQPWASLLMAGVKKYETRSWTTRHRGRLLIHAGAHLPAQSEIAVARTHGVFDLPRGALLGMVDLIEVHHSEDIAVGLTPSQLVLGDYQPGMYAWEVRVIEVFPEVIPCRGRLQLWEYHTHE